MSVIISSTPHPFTESGLSYIEEFWYESYLSHSDSVVLSLNPFFVLEYVHGGFSYRKRLNVHLGTTPLLLAAHNFHEPHRS